MDHQDMVIRTHGSVPRAVPLHCSQEYHHGKGHGLGSHSPAHRKTPATNVRPVKGSDLMEKEGGVVAGQVARLCSPQQAPPRAESLNGEDKGRGCTLWSLRGESDSGRYRHSILGFSGIKMAPQAGHGGSSLRHQYLADQEAWDRCRMVCSEAQGPSSRAVQTLFGSLCFDPLWFCFGSSSSSQDQVGLKMATSFG